MAVGFNLCRRYRCSRRPRQSEHEEPHDYKPWSLVVQRCHLESTSSMESSPSSSASVSPLSRQTKTPGRTISQKCCWRLRSRRSCLACSPATSQNDRSLSRTDTTPETVSPSERSNPDTRWTHSSRRGF